MFFSCAKFRPLRVIKKEIILLTLGWLCGRPQAVIQRRHVSSVRIGLAHGTKRTPSQNWETYYQSCMYPTNNAWPAFLMPFFSFLFSFFFFFLLLFFLLVSVHLRHGLTVTLPPTRVSILHAPPTGTYWVQSPGFPKIVYWAVYFSHSLICVNSVSWHTRSIDCFCIICFTCQDYGWLSHCLVASFCTLSKSSPWSMDWKRSKWSPLPHGHSAQSESVCLSDFTEWILGFSTAAKYALTLTTQLNQKHT